MEEIGRDLGPGVNWIRAYWDEPELDGPTADGLDSSKMEFLYELDADGHVLRAIELMGSDLVPVAAASLAEFWEAQAYLRQGATADLINYESRYGTVPESALAHRDHIPHDEILQTEFDSRWRNARQHLSLKPRSAHFE